ncbi:16S rRNA (uracil(1498)-N(3))-methyltransferase [Ectothiorhodospiraceae bacterium 2226]|nr:16S rRNA (uracil(1498)-N(3))-methyltransferase [Ectothiorhodospiraceae bacterium 2226]
MRIPRLYLPQALREGAQLALEERAAGYLVRVLRLRDGAALRVFDGAGAEHTATLQVRGKAASVVLGAALVRDVESPLRVQLVQGISKGERMDYSLQKAVELGVHRIVPVEASRSVVNLRGERAEKRWAHWRGVVVSACEQCGRALVPEVLPPRPLAEWLAEDDAALRLLLAPEGDGALADMAPPHGLVSVLIGPEGGLSEAEREACRAAGFRFLRLGPRVLRTETAAVAALAVLQARWGDL